MPDAWDDADEVADVLGMLDEYADAVVRARGRLYDFHQLVGGADALLTKVVDGLERIGREDLAQRVRERLVGRNVVPDQWSFELVEAFDRTYAEVADEVVAEVRADVGDGRRHVHERRLKQQRRAAGPTDDTGSQDAAGPEA